jgi:integrase
MGWIGGIWGMFSERFSENPKDGTRPAMSHIRDDDRELVAQWAASLAAAGMALSRIGRTTKRVRAFAEIAEHGLLPATREDLAAFVASRAAQLPGRHVDPLNVTLRGRSLRETVQALRAFYQWAASNRLVDLSQAPVTGLRLPRPANREPLGIVQARPYDGTLQEPGPPHYRAIVWLLAFGLEPCEIVRLRASDVDLERREVRLPLRIMPVTSRAVGELRPWVELRQRFSVGGWLFPGKHGRHASRFCVHDAVRRLARRRSVRASGFRDLFVARAFRRCIAADCVPGLLSVAAAAPRLRQPDA